MNPNLPTHSFKDINGDYHACQCPRARSHSSADDFDGIAPEVISHINDLNKRIALLERRINEAHGAIEIISRNCRHMWQYPRNFNDPTCEDKSC